MPCVKWLWHEGEIWVYIFASKHTFHRFAHMWLIHWKPLLYSCYLMYDDAISMVDFNFWAYEIFEFMVMNVCCCCLNLTMPRILPWLCLFCCWLMLHDDDVAWPCLFLDAEYVLFMFDDWLMDIGDDEYMMLLSLNPSFFFPRTMNIDWLLLLRVLFHWGIANQVISFGHSKRRRFD